MVSKKVSQQYTDFDLRNVEKKCKCPHGRSQNAFSLKSCASFTDLTCIFHKKMTQTKLPYYPKYMSPIHGTGLKTFLIKSSMHPRKPRRPIPTTSRGTNRSPITAKKSPTPYKLQNTYIKSDIKKWRFFLNPEFTCGNGNSIS